VTVNIKHIESADEVEIVLLSNLTGLPRAEIEDMTWQDFHRLSQAGLHFSSFLD
jgi:hypothetical protein